MKFGHKRKKVSRESILCYIKTTSKVVCPSGENTLQFNNTIQCICEKKVKTTWDRPRAKWKDRITEMLHHSMTIMAAWMGNNSFVTPSTLKRAKEEVEKKEILFSTNNYPTVYCLHIGCVSSGTCHKVTMKHMSDYLNSNIWCWHSTYLLFSQQQTQMTHQHCSPQ